MQKLLFFKIEIPTISRIKIDISNIDLQRIKFFESDTLNLLSRKLYLTKKEHEVSND